MPYFLFTGTLMEKIFDITAQQEEQHPEIEFASLAEMGIAPQLLQTLREREIEAQLGEVKMNCEMCKFRLAAKGGESSDHDHSHGHDHGHGHGHGHSHSSHDPYAKLTDYHQRIWQAP